MANPTAKNTVVKDMKSTFDKFFKYILETNFNQQIVNAKGVRADADKKILNMINNAEKLISGSNEYKSKSKELDDTLTSFNVFLNSEIKDLPKNKKFTHNLYDEEKSDFQYWKVLAFKNYSEKKKTIKPDAANPGESAYKLFRESIIDAKTKITQMNTLEKFNRMAYTHNRISPMNTGLTPSYLSKLLESGDAKLRGSSKEYKEIQKEIKQLMVGDHLSDTNTFLINLKALSEKTEKYIKDRKSVEMNYSPDSYKGKRVAIMREVNAILKTIATRIQNSKPEFNLDEVRKSGEIMKNEYPESGFTVSRFKSAFLAEKLKEVKTKGTGFTLENEECEDSYDVVKKAEEKYFAGKEAILNSMPKFFEDQKVDFVTAKKTFEEFAKFQETVNEFKTEKDVNKIRNEFKSIAKINKYNREERGINEAFDIVEKTNYIGKTIGVRSFDEKFNIMKEKTLAKTFKEKLGDLVKVKENPEVKKPEVKKPEPIKNIHMLDSMF